MDKILNGIDEGDVVVALQSIKKGGFYPAIVVGIKNKTADLLFETGDLVRNWPLAYIARAQSHSEAPKEL